MLQLLILLTGNFAFFNWLTISLTVFLFNDQVLGDIVPGLAKIISVPPSGIGSGWGQVILIILAVFYISIGIGFMLLRFIHNERVLEFIAPVFELIQDWRLVNPYGLFTVMTTVHPEIVLEGSQDGENWKPYKFKYKADDPLRRLPVVAPHQPRLDWQMWFAALQTYQEVPWFLHFLECLLEGKPEVLRLLKTNPFPEKPPKYIRGLLYDYKFSGFSERRATGAVWERELLGIYIPPITAAEED